MEEEEDRVVARDEEDSFPCLFHEKKSPLGTGGEAPKARRRMGGERRRMGGERRREEERGGEWEENGRRMGGERRRETSRDGRRKGDIFSESLGYPN
jgi:hypothetical protein